MSWYSPMVSAWGGRPPRRGTWIEIFGWEFTFTPSAGRPPRRGTWIEMDGAPCLMASNMSSPAQGDVD